jgi:hypothetical protein
LVLNTTPLIFTFHFAGEGREAEVRFVVTQVAKTTSRYNQEKGKDLEER